MWMRVRGMAPDVVLKELGVLALPIPVEDLIVGLGIAVQDVEADATISGAAEFDVDARTATIWVNRRESVVRQRFTLAHELGHIMLHPPGRQYRDETLSDSSHMETEANRFAAELLMPAETVRQLALQSELSTRALARAFGVSVPALTIRLHEVL